MFWILLAVSRRLHLWDQDGFLQKVICDLKQWLKCSVNSPSANIEIQKLRVGEGWMVAALTFLSKNICFPSPKSFVFCWLNCPRVRCFHQGTNKGSTRPFGIPSATRTMAEKGVPVIAMLPLIMKGKYGCYSQIGPGRGRGGCLLAPPHPVAQINRKLSQSILTF